MKNNRNLYKRIMEDVSRVVKKHLNENNVVDPVKIEKILANAVKSDKLQIIGTIYDDYACDIDDTVEYLESLGYDAEDDDLYSLLDFKLPINYNFQYKDPDVLLDAYYGRDGIKPGTANYWKGNYRYWSEL